MLIYVDLRSGKQLTFDVDKQQTVANVKTLIEDKEGVSPNDQRLLFHGDLLKDEFTLSMHNISEESTLQLVQRLTLFIVCLDNRKITIAVDDDETIGNLKDKIYHREGVRPDQQTLTFCGKTLSEDEQTVSDYDMKNGSTVNLVLRLPGGYNICVCVNIARCVGVPKK